MQHTNLYWTVLEALSKANLLNSVFSYSFSSVQFIDPNPKPEPI